MERFIERLIERFINRETISYLIFGVLTTAVNYAVYTAALWVMGGDNEDVIIVLAANALAWIFSVAFAYITNKLYVFESRSFKRDILFKEISAFVGARLFSGFCDMAWMAFAVDILTMNDKIAKLLANVFVVVMNYFFSKIFIFKNKKP